MTPRELQDILIARSMGTAEGVSEWDFEEGHWWDGQRQPPGAYTMLGTRRLDRLARSLRDLDLRAVPGDVIEAGVWRGGTLIWMAQHTWRPIYGADSFRGAPPPAWEEDTGSQLHKYAFLAVTEEQVRSYLERFGCADRVMLVKGWFDDTLQTLKNQWALIRIDGDLYKSTSVALWELYPRLSSGGYCIIDDYGSQPHCKRAVDDFRKARNITTPMVRTDYTEVWWVKE